jgi:Tudor domain
MISAVMPLLTCLCSDSDDVEVDVIYVDYGTTEFVPRSHLIIHLPEMVYKSHGSVVRCKLFGIEPVSIPLHYAFAR